MKYYFPLFASIALVTACSNPPVDRTERITTRAAFEAFTNQPCALVTYDATWCHPCHALQPTVVQFANDHPALPIGFVDIEDIRGIAKEQHAESLPEVVIYRNGRAAPLRKHGADGARTDYRELTEMVAQACPTLLKK
jgi:thiol-disulfide isomerase/thioredoxin